MIFGSKHFEGLTVVGLRGSYKLLKKIGEGATSVVFQARNLADSKQAEFAVKVYLERITPPEEKFLTHIIEQSNLFTRCIKHFELFFSEQIKKTCVVMELANGGNLYESQSIKSKLTPKKVNSVMFEISLAVNELHHQGFTHRDLKPENLLFIRNPLEQENVIIKLSDFGLVKETNDLQTSRIGTVQYAAPEITCLDRKTKYTDEVDVWSFGSICYFWLSGSDLISQAQSNLDSQEKINNTIDQNIVDGWQRQLLKDCLKINVEERLTMSQIVERFQNQQKQLIPQRGMITTFHNPYQIQDQSSVQSLSLGDSPKKISLPLNIGKPTNLSISPNRDLKDQINQSPQIQQFIDHQQKVQENQQKFEKRIGQQMTELFQRITQLEKKPQQHEKIKEENTKYEKQLQGIKEDVSKFQTQISLINKRLDQLPDIISRMWSEALEKREQKNLPIIQEQAKEQASMIAAHNELHCKLKGMEEILLDQKKKIEIFDTFVSEQKKLQIKGVEQQVNQLQESFARNLGEAHKKFNKQFNQLEMQIQEIWSTIKEKRDHIVQPELQKNLYFLQQQLKDQVKTTQYQDQEICDIKNKIIYLNHQQQELINDLVKRLKVLEKDIPFKQQQMIKSEKLSQSQIQNGQSPENMKSQTSQGEKKTRSLTPQQKKNTYQKRHEQKIKFQSTKIK